MPTQYRPQQRVDHYTILSLLGQGIASHVYLALDRDTGEQVVLKFPKDDVIGGRAIFERYQREAQIGRLLCHPHILQHLNQDEQRHEKYLVLEYLRGQTLRVAMAKYLPLLLPVDMSIAMMVQVCEALIYAHKHGIIHQDIKPDNIMLLEDGNVKVLDFGIAQIEGEKRRHLPGLTQLVGTPAYMAPERLRGKQGSIQTDIYAVGVVLFELFCGRTPFEEQDGFGFIGEHISHDPPDILQLNPTLSPVLATLVMGTIRRDTDKRYNSLENLLFDLQHVEDITPVAYIPDKPKFGGRYRQVIAISLVILSIFILLILFGILAQSIHHVVR